MLHSFHDLKIGCGYTPGTHHDQDGALVWARQAPQQASRTRGRTAPGVGRLRQDHPVTRPDDLHMQPAPASLSTSRVCESLAMPCPPSQRRRPHASSAPLVAGHLTLSGCLPSLTPDDRGLGPTVRCREVAYFRGVSRPDRVRYREKYPGLMSFHDMQLDRQQRPHLGGPGRCAPTPTGSDRPPARTGDRLCPVQHPARRLAWKSACTPPRVRPQLPSSAAPLVSPGRGAGSFRQMICPGT